MSPSARIVLNALSNWFLIGLNLIIGIALIPFLISRLGTEGFGLAGLATSIVVFGMLADLGLSGALARQLAEQLAKGHKEGFNEVCSSGALVYLLVGLIPGLILFFAADPIVRAFNVSAELFPQAIFLVRYYGPAVLLLIFIGAVYGGVLKAHNRFDVYNIVNAWVSVFRGVLLFIILSLFEMQLYGWALCMFLGDALRTFLQWRKAHVVHSDLHVRLGGGSKAALQSCLSLGGNLTLLRVTQLLSVQSDPIVLAYFLGPTAVSLYKPANDVARLVRPIINTIGNQLSPLATSLHVTGDNQGVQALLIRGTKYTLLMGVAACVLLGVFAEPLMRIWLEGQLGKDYSVTVAVLMAWAVVDLFLYGSSMHYPVLLGMNRIKFLVVVQVPLAILNLIASIILVGYLQMGVIGVMLPTVFLAMIQRPIVFTYVARISGIAVARYFRQSYLMPTVVLVILSIFAIFFRVLINPDDIVSLAGCISFIIMVWVMMTWWVGFNREDRESFKSLLARAMVYIAAIRSRKKATETSADCVGMPQ